MSFRHEQELCSSETTETLTPWIGQNNCQLLIVFWRQWFFFPSDSGNYLPSRIGQRCGCCDRFSGISIGGIQMPRGRFWIGFRWLWNCGMVEHETSYYRHMSDHCSSHWTRQRPAITLVSQVVDDQLGLQIMDRLKKAQHHFANWRLKAVQFSRGTEGWHEFVIHISTLGVGFWWVLNRFIQAV